MKFTPILTSLFVSVFSLSLIAAVGGCEDVKRLVSKEEAPAAAPTKIEPRPGWKYYVGGPVMKPDGYGRYRMGEFQGEVSKPSARGFLVGFKAGDDKKFALATWVNGTQMIEASGFIGDNGIYYVTARTTLDAEGRTMSIQSLEYDFEAETENSKLEYFDPETGESVHTVEASRPFRPDPEEEDDAFFDDDDEEGEGAAE